jgi:hypothetical protein
VKLRRTGWDLEEERETITREIKRKFFISETEASVQAETIIAATSQSMGEQSSGTEDSTKG